MTGNMLLYYGSEEQNAFFCFTVGELGKRTSLSFRQEVNEEFTIAEVPMSKALHYNKAVVDG